MCAILSDIGRNSYKDRCTTNSGIHISAVKIVYAVLDATKKETSTHLMGNQRLVPNAICSGLVSLAVRALQLTGLTQRTLTITKTIIAWTF